MKIDGRLTESAVVGELGGRLAAARIAKNLSQEGLAAAAGVSRSTVERLERGEANSGLDSFLRICRALDLLDRLDALIPETPASPVDLVARQGRQRKRASGRRGATAPAAAGKQWAWKEP